MSPRSSLLAIAALLFIVAAGSIILPESTDSASGDRRPGVLGLLFAPTDPQRTQDSDEALTPKERVSAATDIRAAPLAKNAGGVVRGVLAQIIGGGGNDSHTVCQGDQCVLVGGEGINQCDSNAECRVSHTACRGLQCVTVFEPGEDECANSAQCVARYGGGALPFHNECRDNGLGGQCVAVPGAGPNLCSSNSACGFPGGGCAEDGTCGDDNPYEVVPGDLPGCDDVPLSCPLANPETQCVSSEFSAGHPWGIDIGTAGIGGQPVFAFVDGEAFRAEVPVSQGCGGTDRSHGIAVRLSCNPSLTLTYCHIVPSITPGTEVTAGQQIGTIATTINPGESSSGPHLHFEVREDNVALNPRSYVPCFTGMPAC